MQSMVKDFLGLNVVLNADTGPKKGHDWKEVFVISCRILVFK